MKATNLFKATKSYSNNGKLRNSATGGQTKSFVKHKSHNILIKSKVASNNLTGSSQIEYTKPLAAIQNSNKVGKPNNQQIKNQLFTFNDDVKILETNLMSNTQVNSQNGLKKSSLPIFGDDLVKNLRQIDASYVEQSILMKNRISPSKNFNKFLTYNIN